MHNKPLSRSENMSRIKSKDTQIELILRKALWHRGFRYRVNDKSVFGKPDIVFKSRKIAIFCDSEFWHGKDFLDGRHVVKTNQDYWIPKLKRNIKRDKQVNAELKSQGWLVIRFWSKDIKENLPEVLNEIITTLNSN